jgi:maltose O-acetyltransferase
LVRHIFERVGDNVMVKQNARFGKGRGIIVGNNSQIGERSYIGAQTRIGNDVIMGPDVVIWSVSHAFDRTDIPINKQEGTGVRPVDIGDDVWLGQRVIIMPGVKVGSHSVIGAASVVTKDVPEWAIMGGVPARVIRYRKVSKPT